MDSLSQRVQVVKYLRILVPKAIKGMVFVIRVLDYWVLGPCGSVSPGTVNTTISVFVLRRFAAQEPR